MTPDDAFLADIIEHPNDDGPRLIYADWLEDHGQAERAELIRVQCELARLTEDGTLRREKLQARERALLLTHEEKWTEPFAGLGATCWFRRGLVGGMSIPAAVFLRHAKVLFRSAPLREVFLLEAEGTTARLAECPQLGRLTGLALHRSQIGDAGLRELLGSPYLSRLRRLGLSRTSIGSGGLNALLARSQGLPELIDLDLAGNGLGAAEMGALAASHLLGRLRRLILSNCLGSVGDQACEALAGSPDLRHLSVLDLNRCGITDRGVQALFASASLTGLTDLCLTGNAITAAGAETIAGCAHLSHLRRLELYEGNRIGEAGARALAGSPHLSNLRELHLGGNAIGDAGVEALASSTVLRELRTLYFVGNGIGGRGVRALTRSRFWPRLISLSFYKEPLGDEGANELLAALVPPQLSYLGLEGTGISELLQRSLRERYGDRVRF
jgi:uncharacterized protein (TIGR02996 family)